MINFFIILCWISIGSMMFNYFVYPSVVIYLAKKKNIPKLDKEINEGDFFPKISILLAVYNEIEVIEQKILSTFDTSYPIDKIEFLIGSDSSKDGTDDIIRKYQIIYPQIKLDRFEGRTGKPQIINKLEQSSNGDILILTDANVFFESNTLKELIKHFRNPKIGLVGGTIINTRVKKDGISIQEKSYLSIENKLKHAEGELFGCIMGAFGGVFALRKIAFAPVPIGFIVDDFFLTMKVIQKGYICLNDLKSNALEDVSNISSAEFNRKVRIGKGNFQNLFYFKSFITKSFNISFPFFCHKVLRWLGPFFIICILFSSLYLSFHSQFYLVISSSTLLIICSPFIDGLLKKMNLHLSLLRFASHFTMMNLALGIGFIKYLQKNQSSTWAPTQRNQ